jgi:co-chaperonin GroES (HSP10)
MEYPSIKDFTPLNGRIGIELVRQSDPQNIWRIVSIAKNANLEHYKDLKVGDIVYTDAYTYKREVGTVVFIRPSDILAIHPAQ